MDVLELVCAALTATDNALLENQKAQDALDAEKQELDRTKMALEAAKKILESGG